PGAFHFPRSPLGSGGHHEAEPNELIGPRRQNNPRRPGGYTEPLCLRRIRAVGVQEKSPERGSMPLRMRVHDREPIGAALRRFKKLLERSGLTKELRKRKHYEKPCEARRRAKLRKQSAIRKGKIQAREGAAR